MSTKGTRNQTKEAELVVMVFKQVTESKDFLDMLKATVEAAIESKLRPLIEDIQKIQGKIHDIECFLEKQDGDMKDFKKRIDDVASKAESLADQQNNLEQYSRRNCLRVSGVNEDANEDTDTIIMTLAREKLGTPLSLSDIDRSHRIGQPASTKKRPIIVKFTSYRARASVLKNRRKLKGTGIVIREDLTQRNQVLLKASSNNEFVKSAWTHDGKVIALVTKNGTEFKKQIKCLGDLSQL